jgi:hypothetical protein
MCLADFGKFHAAMTKVIFGANIVFLFVVVTGSGDDVIPDVKRLTHNRPQHFRGDFIP